MYILSAEQIKAWDQYTIQHEPVSSIDLMERAAAGCVEWIEGQLLDQSFIIFCGKGNNGGDGLAIARMLIQKGYPVVVYILELGKPGSRDFEISRQRLQGGAVAIHFIKTEQDFPVLDSGVVLIDALFGSGLSKPLDGLAAALVGYINSFDLLTISIDFPSGLFMDESSIGNSIVRADHTLTFQCQKLGLLVQENAPFIGQVHILDIGLDPRYL